MNSNSYLKKVWAIPLLLAILTIFGLLSALLGMGYWQAIAWGVLMVPLIIILRKVLTSRDHMNRRPDQT